MLGLLLPSLPGLCLQPKHSWKLFQLYLILCSTFSFLSDTRHWAAVSTALTPFVVHVLYLRQQQKLVLRCWVFPERLHSTESFLPCSSDSSLESPMSYLFHVLLHCQSPRLGVRFFWEEVALNRAAGKKALCDCAVSGSVVTEHLLNFGCFHKAFRPSEGQKDPHIKGLTWNSPAVHQAHTAQ